MMPVRRYRADIFGVLMAVGVVAGAMALTGRADCIVRCKQDVIREDSGITFVQHRRVGEKQDFVSLSSMVAVRAIEYVSIFDAGKQEETPFLSEYAPCFGNIKLGSAYAEFHLWADNRSFVCSRELIAPIYCIGILIRFNQPLAVERANNDRRGAPHILEANSNTKAWVSSYRCSLASARAALRISTYSGKRYPR